MQQSINRLLYNRPRIENRLNRNWFGLRDGEFLPPTHNILYSRKYLMKIQYPGYFTSSHSINITIKPAIRKSLQKRRSHPAMLFFPIMMIYICIYIIEHILTGTVSISPHYCYLTRDGNPIKSSYPMDFFSSIEGVNVNINNKHFVHKQIINSIRHLFSFFDETFF